MSQSNQDSLLCNGGSAEREEELTDTVREDS